MAKQSLQALHLVHKRVSIYAPAREDGERFQIMFSDSIITKSYKMTDAKTQCKVKFGIADYLK